MKKHVLILGGGIAGMSAAHELIERDFEVTVLEKRNDYPGGKARSIDVPDSADNGRRPLPGEHGFRFFPGFYQHIIDTMERTPFTASKSVADNLVSAPTMMLTRFDKPPIQSPNGFPKSLKEVKLLLDAIFNADTGLNQKEVDNILLCIWQLITSCKRRREEEYENIGWAEFTRAKDFSPNYRMMFVEGLTRTLVAAKANTANTRTNGGILLQMLFSFTKPHEIADRILNGPTNEAWLLPWLNYLKEQGVNYKFDHEVVSMSCGDNRIKSVVASSPVGNTVFEADYILCALPVERAAKLFVSSKGVFDLDGSLKNTLILKDHVAWMNGIQFFLKEDVTINTGHIIFLSTPWALTAISQAQFWDDLDFSETFGDGKANGVLSVDVSDWDNLGLMHQLPAKECTYGQVIEETWHQLKESLNREGKTILSDDNLHSVFVDDSIIFAETFFKKEGYKSVSKLNEKAKYGSSSVKSNEEPLLVNHVNSWPLRNQSFTKISNLFLASDYVKSNTNLATMEGANEAARRAVNNIIDRSGSKNDHCKIWEFKEPIWTLYYKWLDERRYLKGLPWKRHKWKWYALPLGYILWFLGERKRL